ncbi:MAG: saccharopine dehydrogenase NADP-binding domain-containing protein [Planctomycetota bacterium]|nr:saccharopine dehydrogenase NADP-binding domain-containing protein [Planctomycetota bacterium]
MKCLVIGGGGAVGVSLLYLFKALGWEAAVVDPIRPKHRAEHDKSLRGTVETWTEQQYTLEDLNARLRAETFDAVIDLAPTFDKRRAVTLCDDAGVSLVNSTMVDWREDIHIAAYNFLDNRPQAVRRPHIVASGMNPGALNAMAEDIIRQTEQPDAIVYWEYDDTMPACGKYRGPSITWCPSESAPEIVEDWNFEVLEEGTVLLHEDAMDWPLQSLAKAGVPMDLVPVPQLAEGFLIGHEECVYMGWRHDTAAKFIYGFHPENMRLIRAAGYDVKPELLLRHAQEELIGRDIVGVACRFEDEWRGQYCLLDNTPAIPLDTNATCALVAAGVAAAAMVLADGEPKPGVYLTHELKDYLRAFRTLTHVYEYELIDGASRRILPPVAPAPPPLLGARPAIESN